MPLYALSNYNASSLLFHSFYVLWICCLSGTLEHSVFMILLNILNEFIYFIIWSILFTLASLINCCLLNYNIIFDFLCFSFTAFLCFFLFLVFTFYVLFKKICLSFWFLFLDYIIYVWHFFFHSNYFCILFFWILCFFLLW